MFCPPLQLLAWLVLLIAPCLASHSDWTKVFHTDFDTPAALGKFRQVYGQNFTSYVNTPDTSGHGWWCPDATLSVANGVLDSWNHYDATLDKYVVGVALPVLPRPMIYGKYVMRMKAPVASGYKIAPLLWPDSNVWPSEGEIDFPEGDLDGKSFWAYAHHKNPNNVITGYDTKVDPLAWHVYEIRWLNGSVEFFVDSISVGKCTEEVPDTPMHWVFQTETMIGPTTPPSKTSEGHIQVDWMTAYKYTPGAGDDDSGAAARVASSLLVAIVACLCMTLL